MLCDKYGLTPIKTGEISIKESGSTATTALSGGSRKPARNLKHFFFHVKDRQQRPPVELVIPVIMRHLDQVEKENPRGWVMERGIRQAEHFEKFKEAGFWPDKVVVLQVDPETVKERLATRLIDRQEDKVYSEKERQLMPKDKAIKKRLTRRRHDYFTHILKRTEKFKREALPVAFMYPQHMVRFFDASKPINELFEEVEAWVCTPSPANASSNAKTKNIFMEK